MQHFIMQSCYVVAVVLLILCFVDSSVQRVSKPYVQNYCLSCIVNHQSIGQSELRLSYVKVKQ